MNAPARVTAAPTLSIEPIGVEAQSLLFSRYVTALALLCECQPYVDEPDYDSQIEALLREACAAYAIEMRHAGGRFEIALREPSDGAPAGCAPCGS